MAFYLLQENGSRLLLEQSAPDAIILEGSPQTVIIIGGDDAPRKRRRPRRDETQELFRALEQTLTQLVEGEPLPETITVRSPEPVSLSLANGFDAALDALLAHAREYEDLSRQLQQLRRDFAAYQQAKWEQFLEDEDELMLWM